jgi:hypothetical protein
MDLLCKPWSLLLVVLIAMAVQATATEPLFNNPCQEDLTALLKKAVDGSVSLPVQPSATLKEHVSSDADFIQKPMLWMEKCHGLIQVGAIQEAASLFAKQCQADGSFLAFQGAAVLELGKELVSACLSEGHPALAQKIVSAAVVASGVPSRALRHLALSLTHNEKALLWPDGIPSAVLKDFAADQTSGPYVLTNRQERSYTLTPSDAGDSSDALGLSMMLGDPVRDDLLILGSYEPGLALTPEPAGLRAWIKADSGFDPEFVIPVTGQIGEEQDFHWLIRVADQEVTAAGSYCFDTASIAPDLIRLLFQQFGWARSFHMFYAPDDMIEKASLRMEGFGFDIAPEGRGGLYLDRVELYLPKDSLGEESHWPTPSDFGKFWSVPSRGNDTSVDQEENLASLLALGYLGETAGVLSQSGVTVHDPAQAWPGVNFLTSGHGPELLLLDMQGNLLHKWQCRFSGSQWPEEALPQSFMENTFWRRAHLFPNGDVLAVLDYIVLAKMDRRGNILWAKADKYHHTIQVDDDNSIYTLCASYVPRPEAGADKRPLTDFLVQLTADGEEVRRISLLRALETSPWAPVIYSLDFTHDVLHTNSIQILDGTLADKIPAFKKGNLLLCMHQPSLIAVLDVETESIVWAQSGQWLFPHEPVLLPDESMLLFDNIGPQWNYLNRLVSRVLRFNPVTREVLWEYTGTRQKPFFSYFCGSVSALPNGNLLVSETSGGRVFEITQEKEIVWEYCNPWQSKNEKDMTSVIFEITRFPESHVSDWLKTNSVSDP